MERVIRENKMHWPFFPTYIYSDSRGSCDVRCDHGREVFQNQFQGCASNWHVPFCIKKKRIEEEGEREGEEGERELKKKCLINSRLLPSLKNVMWKKFQRFVWKCRQERSL